MLLATTLTGVSGADLRKTDAWASSAVSTDGSEMGWPGIGLDQTICDLLYQNQSQVSNTKNCFFLHIVVQHEIGFMTYYTHAYLTVCRRQTSKIIRPAKK